MLPSLLISTVLCILSSTNAAYYDSFTGEQISEAKYRQYEGMNLVPYCGIQVKECDEKERRRMDYSCNNLHHPTRGATLTPYRRMLPPHFDAQYRARPSTSGAPLPLARRVRTSIMSDGRVASKRYTNLVPIGAVAITGDVTSIHDTANYVGVTTTCCAPGGEQDPRCAPIRVPDDDVHLRRSQVRCLNLTRPITYQDLGCVPATIPPERVNTSPPLLDLSVIYGNDEFNARRGREGKGGRLRTETIDGREYPPFGSPECLQNQLPRGETRCFATRLWRACEQITATPAFSVARSVASPRADDSHASLPNSYFCGRFCSQRCEQTTATLACPVARSVASLRADDSHASLPNG
ncbi:peroxidase domain-containing protein [Phthorimaea operculella]|nr:peroxidase domain-containing protein [Phthorimaea operculella]